MDIINSFFQNVKDKLSNPFFGTLIIVLLLHHWPLWYTVFNFDDDNTLENKIFFIENYISENLTIVSFLGDVGVATVYMLIGYFLVVATRSLSLFIEFGLMPAITGKIVNKNVVTKNEYDDVVKERESYFDQYEEQRKKVREFSKQIDNQQQQLKLKNDEQIKLNETLNSTMAKLSASKSDNISLSDKNEESNKRLKSTQKDLELTEKHLKIADAKLKGFKSLYFHSENVGFYSSVQSFPPEIRDKVNELKKQNKWDAFIGLGRFFDKGGTIGGELLTEMIGKGLAFDRETREELTPIGQIIYYYREIFEDYEGYPPPVITG